MSYSPFPITDQRPFIETFGLADGQRSVHEHCVALKSTNFQITKRLQRSKVHLLLCSLYLMKYASLT